MSYERDGPFPVGQQSYLFHCAIGLQQQWRRLFTWKAEVAASCAQLAITSPVQGVRVSKP